MANNFTSNFGPFFECKSCDFRCSKKGDFNRHLSTLKHQNRNLANMPPSHFTSITSHDNFVCECGREYKHRSSLSKHRLKCKYLINQDLILCETISDNYNSDNYNNDNNSICDNYIRENKDIITDIKKDGDHGENEGSEKNKDSGEKDNRGTRDDLSKDLIVKVLKENSDIKDILIKQFETMQTQQKALENQQQQLQELIPKIGNNNTVNNVKQRFNINIFLNEKCRDAINIDDFIKQINISLDNLELTKSKGLGEGLSNLLIENINKLSVYERPLHCTDSKRETLYIKDNNVWEKDSNKTKIKSILKNLSQIQYKNVKQWIDINPDYMDNPDKQEYFIDLIRRCSDNIEEIDNKVIKKVCNNINIKDDIYNDE